MDNFEINEHAMLGIAKHDLELLTLLPPSAKY